MNIHVHLYFDEILTSVVLCFIPSVDHDLKKKKTFKIDNTFKQIILIFLNKR